ncbi:MAG: MBL fold metallo-hydrolase, partial [Chloroflexota bacterium]
MTKQTEIRITTLSENTANRGCLGEWGLSMFVEVGGTRVLFDTGGGRTLIPNAEKLGVDLAAVD